MEDENLRFCVQLNKAVLLSLRIVHSPMNQYAMAFQWVYHTGVTESKEQLFSFPSQELCALYDLK